MLAYLLRRLLWLPVIVAAVIFFVFVLGVYGPGDPVYLLLGQHANPEAAERLRHELGLDRPLLVQYADYLARLAQGDFGTSLKYRGQPVARMLESCLKVTVPLNLVAISWSVPLGIVLGLIAAYKKDTLIDHAIVFLVVVGISLPVFAIAPIVLYFLAVQVPLLPPGGWEGILSPKVILPALVLGIGSLAVMVRQTRASVLETIGQDYVRTAYGKGLSAKAVLTRHVLRNALIPVFTILGMMIGHLLSGAFVAELLFGIPGCGRLALETFTARDYPMIMAFTILGAVAFILTNLLVDILYFFLDPRIRRP